MKKRLEIQRTNFNIIQGGVSVTVGTSCGKYRPGPPDHGERTLISLEKEKHLFWGFEIAMDIGTACKFKKDGIQIFQPKAITIHLAKREDTMSLLAALRFTTVALAKKLKSYGIENETVISNQIEYDSCEVAFPWFENEDSGWRGFLSKNLYLNDSTQFKDIPKLPTGTFTNPEREPVSKGNWSGARLVELKELKNLSSILFEHGSLSSIDQLKLNFTAQVLYKAFYTAISGITLKHNHQTASQLAEHIIDYSINNVVHGEDTRNDKLSA